MHYLPGWNWGKAPAFTVWMNAQQFPPAKICAVFGGSSAEGLLKQIGSSCQPGERQRMGLRVTGSVLLPFSSGQFMSLFISHLGKTGPELPPSHHNHQQIP